MLDAVRAEALKFRRHRGTWLMVWIFPIVMALLASIQIGHDLFVGPRNPAAAPDARAWLAQSTILWRMPLNSGGRFLIAGFAALVFASEYGWNTWKLIVPARARWQLMASKWVVSVGFVIMALAAATLIILAGDFARTLTGGSMIPAGVTAGALLHAQGQALLHATVPILYTVAWAGLFAVLTSSLLATVALSIAMILLESMLLPILLLASGYAPWLTGLLMKLLPFYHMANFIGSSSGQAVALPLSNGEILAADWQVSLFAVFAWTGIAAAAAIARFRRQDIN